MDINNPFNTHFLNDGTYSHKSGNITHNALDSKTALVMGCVFLLVVFVYVLLLCVANTIRTRRLVNRIDQIPWLATRNHHRHSLRARHHNHSKNWDSSPPDLPVTAADGQGEIGGGENFPTEHHLCQFKSNSERKYNKTENIEPGLNFPEIPVIVTSTQDSSYQISMQVKNQQSSQDESYHTVPKEGIHQERDHQNVSSISTSSEQAFGHSHRTPLEPVTSVFINSCCKLQIQSSDFLTSSSAPCDLLCDEHSSLPSDNIRNATLLSSVVKQDQKV